MAEEELHFDDVIALGGDKSDFEMLKDFGISDKASVKKSKTQRIEKFNNGEFQDLIAGLGFQALMPQTKKTKKSKDSKEQKTVAQKKSDTNSVQNKNVNNLKPKSSSMKNKGNTVPAANLKSQPKKFTKIDKEKSVKKADKNPTLKKNQKNLKKAKNEEKVKNQKPEIVEVKKSPEPVFEIDVGRMNSQLMFKAAGIWHENFRSDEQKHVSAVEPYVKALKAKALMLLENELKIWRGKNESKAKEPGNANWMKTVSTAGTLSDRVAALSLMIQDAPIHNFHCLETLLAMAKKKGRREAIMGVESLRDLFLSDLLPDNRRLRSFHQHPLDLVLMSLKASDKSGEWSQESCQRRLVLWAFEHRLKGVVAEFVGIVKLLAYDALEASKSKSMSVALELILNKPEQEKALLAILVNKLGDPKYKIASKSLHMLNCIVQKHPLMQNIIVHEVRDLFLRPNLAARAQYYCVCFLSSQMLSHERKEVAQKLIQIYISFFKASVKKKNADNKMLCALLTGVNRAFPYADMADSELLSELDILFRTVHVGSLNTAVQALVLLFQIFTSRYEVSDRFYNALYSVLFHEEVPVCTARHPMLLNLVFRALKADPSEPRVQSFIKRLLQMCSLQQPPFCAAVVTLVAHLVQSRPPLSFGLLGGGKGEASRSDDEEECFVDAPDDDDLEQEEKNETVEKDLKIPTWTHKHQDSMKKTSGYNPLLRNPQYSGSQRTALWEVHSVLRHFHPTVTLFAKNLLEQKYDSEAHVGNPLDDFTLIKFLDRFVYRNPKSQEEKNAKKKGEVSVISTHRRKHHAAFNTAVPVNTPEFLLKQKLSPEEVFFHKYFSSKASLRKSPGRAREEDVESLSDGEFDAFVGSEAGQREIDRELNFADHVYSNKNKKGKVEDNLDESEEEFDESEEKFEDGYGFEMEEGEEDILGEKDILGEGGTFMEEADFKVKSNKRKNESFQNSKKLKKKKNEIDVEEFSLMLEENANSKFDTISSSAVRNKENASAKQLEWEKRQETRELLARKRERAKKGRRGGFNKKKRAFKK